MGDPNDPMTTLGPMEITSDTARGERIAAEQLDAGVSFVNATSARTRCCRSGE